MLQRHWLRQSPFKGVRFLAQVSSKPIAHEPNSKEYQQSLSTIPPRIGINLDSNLLQQAFTFSTYKSGTKPFNDRFIFLGGNVLNFYVSQHLYLKYPNLRPQELREIRSMYIGNDALCNIAQEFGLQNVLLWDNKEIDPAFTAIEGAQALSKSILSILGALHQQQGFQSVKQWIDNYILSKQVDHKRALSLAYPKRTLSQILKSKNRPHPESRIIKETGRNTHSPIFVVGVFSGSEMLGQGHGSRIQDAETLAAKNALLVHFFEESKDIQIDQAGDISSLNPTPLELPKRQKKEKQTEAQTEQ